MSDHNNPFEKRSVIPALMVDDIPQDLGMLAQSNAPAFVVPEQNPHTCGDIGCVLLVPGAPVRMGTNGGCRCLLGHKGAERVRVRKGIRWLAERAAKAGGAS